MLIAKFPEISHFWPSCKCRVTQKLRNSRGLSQNKEPIRSEYFYGYYFSAALIHHESKISGGSINNFFFCGRQYSISGIQSSYFRY